MRGIIVKSIATLWGVAMLFSCKPDLKTIETITAKQGNLPVETASDMKIVYSTHGQIQMTMQAPFMQRFQGENPYMELPDGFVMVFFDSLMNETSRISAKYAIQYEEDQLIDARNDVVVENTENNEKLNTEQLIWDQKNERIYTEKFVKITTSDEVLYGDGFESDERFTSWEIKNPRGTFYVETGEEQEEELPTQQIDTLASPQ
ncbi:MAG: LPS export ABC transporter periplasmic protein LptC [Bacteroidota bacterium]